jgi:upstream activation factor subunit UAF30
MERFDRASNSSAALPPSSAPDPQTNGHSSPIKAEPKVKSETPQTSTPNEDEEESDVVSPPKKKRKRAKPVDNDAKLAAMLQAQENSRARPTRGGNEKKRVIKKAVAKKPKKKSSDKVKKDDDSDLEMDSDGEVKEKVRKGGFHVSISGLIDRWAMS